VVESKARNRKQTILRISNNSVGMVVFVARRASTGAETGGALTRPMLNLIGKTNSRTAFNPCPQVSGAGSPLMWQRERNDVMGRADPTRLKDFS
jgi:hypothetical protein